MLGLADDRRRVGLVLDRLLVVVVAVVVDALDGLAFGVGRRHATADGLAGLAALESGASSTGLAVVAVVMQARVGLTLGGVDRDVKADPAADVLVARRHDLAGGLLESGGELPEFGETPLHGAVGRLGVEARVGPVGQARLLPPRMHVDVLGTAKVQEHQHPVARRARPTVAVVDRCGVQQTVQQRGLLAQDAAHGVAVAGVSRAVALDAFLREHGYLVNEKRLLAWARERGISVAAGRMPEAVSELRADRDALGLWTPPKLLHSAPPPAPAAQTTAPVSVNAPARRSGPWTIDDVRAGLILAVAERQRRGARQLTQAPLKT